MKNTDGNGRDGKEREGGREEVTEGKGSGCENYENHLSEKRKITDKKIFCTYCVLQKLMCLFSFKNSYIRSISMMKGMAMGPMPQLIGK